MGLDAVVHSVLGILSRGCKPDTIAIRLGSRTMLERRAAVEKILDGCALAGDSASGPMPTTCLKIQASLLSRAVAIAASKALPYLDVLCLMGINSSTCQQAKTGLAPLLLLNSDEAAEGGNCSPTDSSTQAHRHPISALCMEVVDDCDSLLALIALLRNCASLRGLRLTFRVLTLSASRPALRGICRALAPLTQLRALNLDRVTVSTSDAPLLGRLTSLQLLRLSRIATPLALQPLLSNLRDLQKLGIKGCDQERLPLRAATLAPLSALRELDLPWARLLLHDPHGRLLAPLPALAFLRVYTLKSPFPTTDKALEAFDLMDTAALDAVEADFRAAARALAEGLMPSFALPPALEALQVTGRALQVEVLGGLQLPACMQRVDVAGPWITIEGMYFATAVRGLANILRPDGERALRSALETLARYWGEASGGRRALGITFAPSFEVQPGAPVRPAPRLDGSSQAADHCGWLAALGGLGLSQLALIGFHLAEADVQMLVQSATDVQDMSLRACALPPQALPLLTRLPRLKTLALEVGHWLTSECEDGAVDLGDGMWLPRDAAMALLAACSTSGATLRRLSLSCWCSEAPAPAVCGWLQQRAAGTQLTVAPYR